MSDSQIRHSREDRREYQRENDRNRQGSENVSSRRDENRLRYKESANKLNHDDKRGQSDDRPRNSNKRHHVFDENARRNRDRDGHRGKKSRFDMNETKELSPEWGKAAPKEESKPVPVEKEKPNFQTSGKLAEDANTVNGVVIKYTESVDAMKPKKRWRLYPFKGDKALPTLYIHRQSAYLLGRHKKIADIPLDHTSCSKQHAALQYRLVNHQKENGENGRCVKPYLIDLESANGTYINNVKLEPRRYHELLERDVIRFGLSSREYVLLHEQSTDETLDDDVANS